MIQVSNLLSCSTSPRGNLISLKGYYVKAVLLEKMLAKATLCDNFFETADLIKNDFIGLHEYKERTWE